MLSTSANLLQIASAAPWVAMGVLSLLAGAWTYRQGRAAVAAAEGRCRKSAEAQGRRLGELEKAAGMLDLRRRQVEWTLLDLGVDLPYWPADGPGQPRAARRDDERDERAPDTEEARRIPVPPLDPAVGSRHRRTAVH